jgi:hypothetical protein
MHRDKKVGLALAILLCSIVGAFFFRDDAPRHSEPDLKDGSRLDQKIARDNSRGPYSETESRPRGTDPRRPTDRTRDGFQQSDLPEFLRENPSAGTSTTQRNRVNSSRDPSSGSDRLGGPSDFNLTPPPQDFPARPIGPLHNGDWDAVSNDAPGIQRGGIDVAPAITLPTRSHVVVDGETLSSIAGKYLGSQTRYQEIFQANRDQLKSVNDLKIGMKLIIPERGESRSTNVLRGGSRIESSPAIRTTPTATQPQNKVTERPREPAGATEVSKPKFKPAKANSSIRRTTDASEEELLDNKLSQVAPSDLLEVDEGVLAELEQDLETQVAEKPAEATMPK